MNLMLLLTLIMFAVAIGGLGWSVWWLRKEHQLFSSTLFKPKTFRAAVPDPKGFENLLKAMSGLTMEESLLVAQQSFGRPIRAVVVLDDAGRIWIETVTHYQPEGDYDGDWYSKIKDDEQTAKGYTG